MKAGGLVSDDIAFQILIRTHPDRRICLAVPRTLGMAKVSLDEEPK
jgi:hypothetical protein